MWDLAGMIGIVGLGEKCVGNEFLVGCFGLVESLVICTVPLLILLAVTDTGVTFSSI